MSQPVTPCHDAEEQPEVRFLRYEEVETRVGLQRRQIYRLINAESFPKPVQLTGRLVGFVESEVAAWMAARMSDRVSP